MPVGRAEPIVQVCPLEHVESPVERDLPASVCHEVPGVDPGCDSVRRGARRSGPIEDLWSAIGRIVQTFTPQECEKYFAAAWYDPD